VKQMQSPQSVGTYTFKPAPKVNSQPTNPAGGHSSPTRSPVCRRHRRTAAYDEALREEFDQFYEEGARRRRMMSSVFTIASPVTRTGCARSTDS